MRAIARYCTAPRAIHWKAALDILEYINGTSEHGITFRRGTLSSISLEAFADADYASKATDGRSVSGGAIMCEDASVCWFSRTQKCVTLSTSEAEYVALGDAVDDLLFLRQVWRLMLPSKVMPYFPVFKGNQGAVQLAQNPVANSISKHIDVLRHHFRRELVRQRDIMAAVNISRSTIGGVGDTTIPSPVWSSKQPFPGIGLHDPQHGRQACPESTSFHQGVGQTFPREGLFSCRSLPKRGQICDIPDPPNR